jgi:hypothetical protein
MAEELTDAQVMGADPQAAQVPIAAVPTDAIRVQRQPDGSLREIGGNRTFPASGGGHAIIQGNENLPVAAVPTDAIQIVAVDDKPELTENEAMGVDETQMAAPASTGDPWQDWFNKERDKAIAHDGLREATLRAPTLDEEWNASSPGKALATGMSALTGGWANKAHAMYQAYMNHTGDQGGMWDRYHTILDRDLANMRGIRDYDPDAAAMGNLAGTLVQGVIAGLGGGEMTLAKAAAQGGGLGFLNGSGQARGDVMQQLGGGLEGAAIGAGLGGAMHYAIGGNPAMGDIYGAYERQGVPVTAAVNGGPVTTSMLQLTRHIPIVGTRTNQAVADQAVALGNAIKTRAGNLSNYAEPDAYTGGMALQNVAAPTAETIRQGAGAAFEDIPAFQANPSIPLTNTTRIWNEMKDATPDLPGYLQGAAPKAYSIVRQVEGAGGGLKVNTARTLRTDVGSLGESLPNPVDAGRMNALYGGFSQDIEDGIGATAFRDARQAGASPQQATAEAVRQTGMWRQADQDYEDAIDLANRVVGKTIGEPGGAMSPERAFSNTLRLASSDARADVGKLRTLRQTMPDATWQEFQAGVITNMGRDGDGNFSPAKFATAYSKLSEGGKDALFGHELRPDMEDFASMARDMKAAGAQANHSHTGGTNALLVGAAAAGHALTTHGLGALPEVIGALGGGLAVGRVLGSPGVMRLLVRARPASPAMMDDLLGGIAKARPEIAPYLNFARSALIPTVISAATQAVPQDAPASAPTVAPVFALPPLQPSQ